jgi:vitamin B12 transporter
MLSGTTASVYSCLLIIMKSLSLAPRLSLLASAMACAIPAVAQSNPTLPEVVVTATRLETRTDALVSDVTIIEAADLEKLNGLTLTEVISRLAGVQLIANGGRGTSSTLLIRGTESRHVLLLVDGVRMGSATLGAASFDNIALESIDRIEVLKGPASALYGSDAVGGVVQIFTKRGTKGLTPSASVTVGSKGHRAISAGISGSSGPLRFSAGVGHLQEKGFSATNEAVAFGSFNPDADGFKQESAFASIGADVAPGWSLDARASTAKATSHWDNGPGNFDPTNKVTNTTISIALTGQVMPAWKTVLRLGQADDKFTSRSDYGNDNFDTVNTLLSWNNEIATPVGALLVGLEQLKDEVDSNTAYDLTARTVNAAFVGLTGSHGGHAWQANARRDSNSQFGDATTAFAGYSYKITPNWRLLGSYGTSFKAPSFNQLYYPKFGNATTRPEKGRNSELGLAYTQGPHEVKLTRFDNRIQGFITDLPVVTNIPQARIKGWSLAYQAEVGATRMHASFDQLDARNVLTGAQLPRRAERQITLGADTAVGAWTFGGNLVSMAKRYDNAANTIDLAPFVTADLFANYRVASDWVLQGRINNVTDKVYETAKGYNQPGRSFFLTLRYQPK